MKSVGVFEAKARLSALIEDAAAGRTTIITKNGKPVAEIGPLRAAADGPARAVPDRIRALRKQLDLRSISARELIDEGRR